MSKTNISKNLCPFCGDKLYRNAICEVCDYDKYEDKTLDLVEQFEANERSIDFGWSDVFGS